MSIIETGAELYLTILRNDTTSISHDAGLLGYGWTSRPLGPGRSISFP